MAKAKPTIWIPGLDRSDSLAQSLVAHWPFWEGAGDQVRDVAGISHGTNTDATWVTGSTGYRLELDGTVDYIQASAPTLTDPNVFTMASWVLANSVTNRQTIWGRENVTRAPQLEFRGGSNVAIIAADPGTFVCESTAIPPTVFDNTWHFIVYRRWGDQAGEQEFWIDGNLVGLLTDNAHTLVDSATLNFGRRAAGSQLLTGQLGQQMLFDRSLLDQEVKTLFNHPYRLITEPISDWFYPLLSDVAAPSGFVPYPHIAGMTGGIAT